jgi:hypothetical protein
LAEGVSEEKIKMWKVNGWWMPSDGKSSRCLCSFNIKCIPIYNLLNIQFYVKTALTNVKIY